MRIAAVVLAGLVAGCSYNADVAVAPSYSVVSSYGTKIPGKWLLYVEAQKLDREVKTSTFACSAHKFPVKAADSFRVSANQTIGNLVEAVEVVSAPVDAGQIAAMGARGIIIVRGEEIRPKMDVKPGFWTASMDSQAIVVATVSVDGRRGRLLGQTVEGTGFATSDAGGACEGGSKALAEAIGQGMGDVMRKVGEAISNSERVRAS